jgi:hypothetical protein
LQRQCNNKSIPDPIKPNLAPTPSNPPKATKTHKEERYNGSKLLEKKKMDYSSFIPGNDWINPK